MISIAAIAFAGCGYVIAGLAFISNGKMLVGAGWIAWGIGNIIIAFSGVH